MIVLHRALLAVSMGLSISLAVQARTFAFDGSDCSVFKVIPTSASEESVPTNTAIDVFFYSSRPSECATRLSLWDDDENKMVPTMLQHQTSWQAFPPYTDRQYTFVRYEPVSSLIERHHYVIRFNGQEQSRFVTGADHEGDFIDMVPAIFTFPGCPLKSAMSASDIRLCGMRLVQFFFSTGSSVLTGEKGAFIKNLSLSDKQVLGAYAHPRTLFEALPLLTQYNPNLRGMQGINLYRIRYFTRDPLGRSVIVSGLFARPQKPRFNENRVPIIELLHTHSAPQSSPSDGNMIETFFAMTLASRGFYVFAPDNLGHGVSQSSVEPFLDPISMFDTHKDGLHALLQGLGFDHWNGELSIFGGSQGAFDGMNLFRYFNSMSYPYDIKNVYLSEGPMNVEREFVDIMKYDQSAGQFQSPYMTYVKNDVQGVFGLARLYMQARETYGVLQQGATARLFDASGKPVPSERDKFLAVDPGYLNLRTEMLGSTLVNNTDTYDAPDTTVRIYAYPKDTLVAAAAGQDMLRFLGRKGNRFARLEKGSCLDGSRIELVVAVLMHIRPEIAHVYCILVAANDFVHKMLLDYRLMS